MAKEIKVACSPLTNVIYAGTLKNKNLWADGKQDVTMQCLIATIEHCLKFGDTVQIQNIEGEVEFEIDVKDLRESTI